MTDHIFEITTEREVYTVSQLNQESRLLLEGRFPLIWVEGEISNVARPASGHIYFSLKDPQAQVRCAMFRSRNNLLNFAPDNGMQVLVRAKVSLYEGRGDYQLIAEHMEEAGDGALRRAFEELQQKLSKEGLFAAEHKKPLPVIPKCIGVVTSPTGAAIRDILSVMRRRFPSIPIIIYPTEVQGANAPAQIAKTLQLANQRQECDVLLVSRGGGSLEDLWAFNEEVVARSIFASEIPIVSGVGHEIDFTISDFVADQRAPTPSAAAELVSPNQQEWLDSFGRFAQRLVLQMKKQLAFQQQHLQHLEKRLQHPGRKLQQQMQHVDHLEQSLLRVQEHYLQRKKTVLTELVSRLLQQNPVHYVANAQTRLQGLSQQLQHSMKNLIQVKQQQLENLGRALDTVSPLATLNRGYAIVSKQDGTIVRDVKQVARGDQIHTRLSNGKLLSEIIEIEQP